ncbi:hypothetical protein MBLNU459_g4521t1 [Dothideomycetes sp. NU459]
MPLDPSFLRTQILASAELLWPSTTYFEVLVLLSIQGKPSYNARLITASSPTAPLLESTSGHPTPEAAVKDLFDVVARELCRRLTTKNGQKKLVEDLQGMI